MGKSGRKWCICAVGAALLATALHAGEESVGTWWHWMNGHITREGIEKDLDAMAAAGIANVTIFNAYRPFGSQFKMSQTAKENVREIDEGRMTTVKFASKEWMELFRFALDEAARRGITVGAANCDGWSESGGPWITPELAMKELVWSRDGSQPMTRDGFYRDIATVNGIRFGYTTNGKKNHPASPEGCGLECDKMDSAALAFHFAHYPKWLIEAAGPHAGRTFKYFLVDSWECGFQTWTAKFPEEFKRLRGYDPIPWLPVLAGDVVGSEEDSRAFLHDYNLTCSDLIIENYFKPLAELCHEHGMLLYSEGIYGWDNLPAVDVLKTYKYCDVPMTEFWAKVAAHDWPFKMSYVEPLKHFSPQHAAVLYGKPVVAAEAYTGYGIYSDSPFDLKPYGDRAFAGGLNKMILHSYVHQPFGDGYERKPGGGSEFAYGPGLTLGIYGQAFNRLNPWYNFSRSFWEYHERIQAMMQGGVFVADSLVYMGDVLPAFEMKDHEIARLLPCGRTFQYINQDVLLSGRVKVKDGLIWLDDDKCYSEILIRQDALDLATIEKLDELHKAGARVGGVKPARTLRLLNREEETARLSEIADRIWGGEEFVAGGQGPGDIALSDGDQLTIRARHVRKGERDIYFLASAFDFEWRTLKIRFNNVARAEKSRAKVVDPVDGTAVRAVADGDGVFTFRMHPRQALLIVFGDEDTDSLEERRLPQHEIVFDRVNGHIVFESTPDLPAIPIGRFHSLTEDADPDIKYYCGVLRYDFSLALPAADGRVYLDLPAFGSTAEVTVNGRLMGTMWDPYAPLDITSAVRSGENSFSIRCTNPWRNRLIGDLVLERGADWAFTTSPGIDKYDMKPHISKKASLIPTGISKPLRILY